MLNVKILKRIKIFFYLPLIVLLSTCSSLNKDKTPLIPPVSKARVLTQERITLNLGSKNSLFLEELSNGLKVLILEMPSSPISYGMIAVQVGGRYEPDSYAGISHLLEHMLFKEKDDFKPLTVIRESGGSVNAITDFELTKFYFTVLPEHFDEAMRALSCMVIDPHFDEKDLITEKEVVLEELAMGKNDPRTAVLPALVKKIFPESSLANLVIGNKKSIQRISYTDLKNFYNAYYAPDNMVVVAAGNIRAEKTVEYLKTLFGNEVRRPVPEKTFEIPEIAINKLNRKIPINQAFYIVGALVPGKSSEDFYAMKVLDLILGSGVNSRLYNRIVMDEGFTDELYPYWFSLSDTGMWAVFLSLNPEDMSKVSLIADEEITYIKKGHFSIDELANAKKALISRSIIELDKPEDIARFELENLVFREKVLSVQEYIETLKGVSKQDIINTANRYFTPENIITIELEPADVPYKWFLMLKYLLTEEL